jgi:hypothetical protein
MVGTMSYACADSASARIGGTKGAAMAPAGDLVPRGEGEVRTTAGLGGRSVLLEGLCGWLARREGVSGSSWSPSSSSSLWC